MLRALILFSVLAANNVLLVNGWSKGFAKVTKNFLHRANKKLSDIPKITSFYVGATGIWWRQHVIASISEMEQGKQEQAMETLNIAIATLTVFDVTQATVSPIASEFIHQIVKHKGFFKETHDGLKAVNKITMEVTRGSADTADDIINTLKTKKKDLALTFQKNVEEFMRNTKGYEELVTSLNKARNWAKALTWADTLSGPFFDAANMAWCGWQLHNAINDKDSPPEVRSMNIASASLGVASGAVGLTAFVVGALATAGTALAAFAGPVGAIIGCLLSLASIVIDLINSQNPYGRIKDHIGIIQKLKEGSLEYLENQVNITKEVTPYFKHNTGFNTIYEINQGNLIEGMRSSEHQPIQGVDNEPNLIFSARSPAGRENGYITRGKKRTFDKSNYANIIYQPEGTVDLGYDFYGKKTKEEGQGVTIIANTAMVAKDFWIRGVHIDTRVENDEEQKNPDNVVIGEMTGLGKSDHNIRVFTGAGDDILQVVGLPCNAWTLHQNCFWGELGTGVNTLCFDGMDPDRVKFPMHRTSDLATRTFVGIKFDMRPTQGDQQEMLLLKMKDTDRSPIVEHELGYVVGVSVFHGSPQNDLVIMGDDKNCIVKQRYGKNKYVVHFSKQRDFTHTIIEESNTPGELFLFDDNRNFIETRDIVFDSETQTLVIFMRDSSGNHKSTGKVIFKRTKRTSTGTIGDIQLNRPKHHSIYCDYNDFDFNNPATILCFQRHRLKHNIMRDIGLGPSDKHFTPDDRPVPEVPFYYYMKESFKVSEIPGICGDFIIKLGPVLYYSGDNLPCGQTRQVSLEMPSSSYVALSDSLFDEISNYENHAYALYYTSKKLVFEFRPDALCHTVEVTLTGAKRIVSGTVGNHQLLLDLQHDKRSDVNLGSEYIGLKKRPEQDYRFDKNYYDLGTQPKQIVLGAPAKDKTFPERWRIELGEARSYNYHNPGTGNYAENALIVTDTLWAFLSEEDRKDSLEKITLEFKAPEGKRKQWDITIKKGKEKLHKVRVKNADTLAFQQGLLRTTLHDLHRGEKRSFDLYEVLDQKMKALDKDAIAEANRCR